jgi:hypothetical protein
MDEDYTLPKKIIDKDEIQMERIEKNKYILKFSIKSNNLYLKKLIGLDIIKILYEVNKDIFDDFDMNQSGERAEVYFLIKHFFSDFGLPQKYMHLQIQKIQDEKSNAVLFFCQNANPDLYTSVLNIPNKGEQMNTDLIHVVCYSINDHQVDVVNTILLNECVDIPAVVEKMAGILISKMFLKVKQFIETATNV